MDELSCLLTFYKTQEDAWPDLNIAIEDCNDKIEKRQAAIRECENEEEFLERRLERSGNQLFKLFRHIYDNTDMFVSALDDAGRLEDGTSVPKEPMTASKIAADCSRLVAGSKERLSKNARRLSKEA